MAAGAHGTAVASVRARDTVRGVPEEVRPPTIARALDAERERLFVGRDAELEQLSTLCDRTSDKRLVSISGPGGVGKTELVAAFSRLASRSAIPVVAIDSADVSASEAGVTSAVDEALAEAGGLVPALQITFVCVIVFDRFELLGALETWFRERFLPSLDARFRFIIAGRSALSPAWSTHPSWRSLHVAMRLDALPTATAKEYLARRLIPPERHHELVSVTHAHPLALAMFADLVEHDPTRSVALDTNPEAVQALLSAIIDDAESQDRRDALWLLALARHTTEDLLGAVITAHDRRRAHALHIYLERLSFVRHSARGLVPHDLVRELLMADLTWRAPAECRRLVARAAAFYRSHGASTQRKGTVHAEDRSLTPEAFADIAYLWRLAMPVAGLTTDGLYVSAPRPGDVPALAAIVLRHQGPHAAALFERWASRGGELAVVRGPDERPRGGALYLELARLAPADIAADPIVSAVVADLADALDGALLVRWTIDRDDGEAPSPTTAALIPWEVERLIWSGEVTLGLSVWRDPAHGLQGMPPGMLEVVAHLTTELDGHACHVVRTTAGGRDLATWFADGLFAPLLGADARPRALDQDELAAAVRAALRDFHLPDRLATNPLLGSPLVPARGAPTAHEGVAALRTLLRDATRELGGESDAGVDRAVIERTYFAERAKQLAVAADLGLPFGSYRRRLAAATARLVAWLWLRVSPTDG